MLNTSLPLNCLRILARVFTLSMLLRCVLYTLGCAMLFGVAGGVLGFAVFGWDAAGGALFTFTAAVLYGALGLHFGFQTALSASLLRHLPHLQAHLQTSIDAWLRRIRSDASSNEPQLLDALRRQITDAADQPPSLEEQTPLQWLNGRLLSSRLSASLRTGWVADLFDELAADGVTAMTLQQFRQHAVDKIATAAADAARNHLHDAQQQRVRVAMLAFAIPGAIALYLQFSR